MNLLDLEPAAERMADLVRGCPNGSLGAPTPCADYSLGDLLDHVDRFALGFTAAATKAANEAASESPVGDATRLGDDWRSRIPRHLAALTESWRDPAAYEGMTKAGGVELPGEVAVVVALEELVLHGWDVAAATGQAYHCAESELDIVQGFVSQFAAPDQDELRGDAYRAPVPVPAAAPLLDRVVALSGRDPSWSPA